MKKNTPEKKLDLKKKKKKFKKIKLQKKTPTKKT